MTEHRRKSAIKAFSWRIIATLTTVTIVYLITGEVVLALEVGTLEVIVKTVFYYLHERIWARIQWNMTGR